MPSFLGSERTFLTKSISVLGGLDGFFRLQAPAVSAALGFEGFDVPIQDLGSRFLGVGFEASSHEGFRVCIYLSS